MAFSVATITFISSQHGAALATAVILVHCFVLVIVVMGCGDPPLFLAADIGKMAFSVATIIIFTAPLFGNWQVGTKGWTGTKRPDSCS